MPSLASASTPKEVEHEGTSEWLGRRCIGGGPVGESGATELAATAGLFEQPVVADPDPVVGVLDEPIAFEPELDEPVGIEPDGFDGQREQ